MDAQPLTPRRRREIKHIRAQVVYREALIARLLTEIGALNKDLVAVERASVPDQAVAEGSESV